MSGQQAQNRTDLGNRGVWEFSLYVCWAQISCGPCSHQPYSLVDKLYPNQKINFKKITHCAKCQENSYGAELWHIGEECEELGCSDHSLEVMFKQRNEG